MYLIYYSIQKINFGGNIIYYLFTKGRFYVMARPRKDAKYLNVYIERDIHERFDEFCKKFGQSKTVATERALSLYMDEMEKRFDGKIDSKALSSDQTADN